MIASKLAIEMVGSKMTGSAERTIMANGPAQIEVRDLHFGVSGQAILNGIDLTLAPGERLAIIGPVASRPHPR